MTDNQMTGTKKRRQEKQGRASTTGAAADEKEAALLAAARASRTNPPPLEIAAAEAAAATKAGYAAYHAQPQPAVATKAETVDLNPNLDFKFPGNPTVVVHNASGGTVAAAADPAAFPSVVKSNFTALMAGFSANPNAFSSVKPEFATMRTPLSATKSVRVKKEPGVRKLKATKQAVIDLTESTAALSGLESSMSTLKVAPAPPPSRLDSMKKLGRVFYSGAMIFSAKNEIAGMIHSKLNLAALFSKCQDTVFMESISNMASIFAISNLKEVREVATDGQTKYTADIRFDEAFLKSDNNITDTEHCTIYKASQNIEQASGGTIVSSDVLGVPLKFFMAMFPAEWMSIFADLESLAARCYLWQARIGAGQPLEWFVSIDFFLLGAMGAYDWKLITGSRTVSNIKKIGVDPRVPLMNMGIQLVHAFTIARYVAVRDMMASKSAAMAHEIAQMKAAVAQLVAENKHFKAAAAALAKK